MQNKQYYCDKTQGTVEVTLSKKEIGVADTVITVDYKLKEENVYDLHVYYGLTTVDILNDWVELSINSTYLELKDNIVDMIRSYLNYKDKRQDLRDKLKDIKLGIFTKIDTDWRVYKFYISDDWHDCEKNEITVAFNDIQVNFYVTDIVGNNLLMCSENMNDIKKDRENIDIIGEISKIINSRIEKGGDFKKFIDEHSEIADLHREY